MRATYPPPFSTDTDVLNDRDLDTVYQNTTGKLMLVVLVVQHSVNVAGVEYAKVVVTTDENNPPVTGVSTSGFEPAHTNPVMQYNAPIAFVVQPLHYYKVTAYQSANGSNVKANWHEVT